MSVSQQIKLKILWDSLRKEYGDKMKALKSPEDDMNYNLQWRAEMSKNIRNFKNTERC